MSNPWNGKVVLQAFWWNCRNTNFDKDWFTFLAMLAPRLAEFGIDGIWTPPPFKDDGQTNSMGYTPFDLYDLGAKNQRELPTRFGTQDAFLRLIAVAHANGLEVYPDIVLDHCKGAIDKNYQYPAFAGANKGRWPRSSEDFHNNSAHNSGFGDWIIARFGDDICYRGRCSDLGHTEPESYMRTQTRAWFQWFVKQTGVDGFRFDDVKDFPPEVVEDILFNAMGDNLEYFCVGEFIPNEVPNCLDQYCDDTKQRCGTFDYRLRSALVDLVYNADFDMGSLPSRQQQNRFKTVPFVNNHDVWHGQYWDSSGDNDDDHTGRAQNSHEVLGSTVDPQNRRAQLAYAFAMTIDGSPQLYYDDFFINDSDSRFNTTAAAISPRFYMQNLVWCHQKLAFKSGDYFVRYQDSQRFLILERGNRAIVALNNDDNNWQSQWISTAFPPNTPLHDYSGACPVNLQTNEFGWVQISTPPLSYSVWGPLGVDGDFEPASRRTLQQFEMDDDLGDSDPNSLQYGGRAIPLTFRTAGGIWPAMDSTVNVFVYADSAQDIDFEVQLADATSVTTKSGSATPGVPFEVSFKVSTEKLHRLGAKLSNPASPAAKLYVKVDYIGPTHLVL